MKIKLGLSFVLTSIIFFVVFSFISYTQNLLLRPRIYFVLFLLLVIGGCILIYAYFFNKTKIAKKKSYQMIYLISSSVFISVLVIVFISLTSALLPNEKMITYQGDNYLGLKKGDKIELYKIHYQVFIEETPVLTIDNMIE